MFSWLQNEFPEFTITCQAKFDWCVSEKGNCLLFDFWIEELDLLIELDGDQHFRQVLNWKPPEVTQSRDIRKMLDALQNGFHVIRIYQEDVWRDLNGWEEDLSHAITKSPKVLNCIETTKTIVNSTYEKFFKECSDFI